MTCFLYYLCFPSRPQPFSRCLSCLIPILLCLISPSASLSCSQLFGFAPVCLMSLPVSNFLPSLICVPSFDLLSCHFHPLTCGNSVFCQFSLCVFLLFSVFPSISLSLCICSAPVSLYYCRTMPFPYSRGQLSARHTQGNIATSPR